MENITNITIIIGAIAAALGWGILIYAIVTKQTQKYAKLALTIFGIGLVSSLLGVTTLFIS